MRLSRTWTVLFPVGFIALFLLLASSPGIQPRFEIQVDSDSIGKSQMYFASTENGFAETRSQSRPLTIGTNTLRFPFGLARGTVGDFQRWDPNDRPSGFVVTSMTLRSGFMSRDVPLTELRPSIAASEIVLSEAGAAFRTDSNDGQLLLNVPARSFYFTNLLLTAAIAIALSASTALLVALIRRTNRGQPDATSGTDPQLMVTPRILLVARISSIVVVALVVTRYAWLSDDALITIRTALNAVTGYGPVFNIDERVQAFTHPLWFVLITTTGWLTGQWMAAPMVLGIITTTAAVGVIVFRVTSISRLVVFTAALVVSNAFVEYATSGLENGLSYLLIAGLLLAAHQLAYRPAWMWSIIASLLTGALLLNRLDLALLIAPLGVYVLWLLRRHVLQLIAMISIILGLMGAWFIFSLAYYGSLLPTTFTAKTNVDIPRSELLLGGIRYLAVSFTYDPATLIILLGGAFLTFLVGGNVTRLIAAGIVLYLLYVVWIGGDFMAGRFLAVPVFALSAALMLERSGDFAQLLNVRVGTQSSNPDQRRVMAAPVGAGALVLLLLLAGWGRSDVLNADLPDEERWDWTETGGVSDERGYYLADGRGLWQFIGKLRPIEQVPQLPQGTFIQTRPPDLVELQQAAADWPRSVKVTDVEVICGRLGERGVMGGPSLHIIDPCGLTDAFLASLAFESRDFNWRAGHFQRELPAGYTEAVRLGDPRALSNEDQREQLIEIWLGIR